MIELELVILRPLEREDINQLYIFRNDYEITRQLGGFSSGFSHTALKEWLEFHRQRNDEILWAIATKTDNLCIGHVGLYQIDYRVRKAEFGILIGDKNKQGKGIGKSVSCAVLNYAFQQLNLHKVSLSVLATNERAIKLYQAIGFQKEGILRHDQFRDGQYVDSILMSCLESEWGKNS
jgi:[ribosomal protein S5]-alanine N-acetyltransferase